MRAVQAAAFVVVALVLQTTLLRFVPRGSVGVDLVLVAVIYLSLKRGPTAGMITGTVGGLVQDALTTGVVGIGSLGKTIVGYLAGTIGAAFIVAQPLPRFLVFFAATILEMGVVTGLHVALDAGPPVVPAGAILAQALGNSLVGVVVFQLAEGLPRAAERRRVRR